MKKKLFKINLVRMLIAAAFLATAASAFIRPEAWNRAVMKFQFSPALLASVADWSLFSCGVLFGILLLTLLFGRFYCACFCPLGILQDLFAFILRRPGRKTGNFAVPRYAAAGIVYGMLAAGTACGFIFLDPYSISGRMFSGAVLGGFILPAAIAAAALWRRRIFCTALCPVGTVLGVISRVSLFTLGIADRCVKCGKCVKVCASGCIDPASGTVDNERCVRCLNCLSVCPLGSVGFTLRKKKTSAPPVDRSRRAFLVNGGILLAGVAAGAALVKSGAAKLSGFAAKFKVLPPGAGNAARFAAKCTSCQLCTVSCPAKIIVPAPGGIGPVSLDLSRGSCQFYCSSCSNVCPTGAIPPLTLEKKQRTKIAEAVFDPRRCIVFQEGEKCGRCGSVCPTGAITLRRNGAPRPVDGGMCIGCGACQEVCPAPEKAMIIHGIPEQTEIEE